MPKKTRLFVVVFFMYSHKKGTTLNKMLKDLHYKNINTQTPTHIHIVDVGLNIANVHIRNKPIDELPPSPFPHTHAPKKWSHKISITFDAKIKLKAIPKGNRSTNVEKLRLLLYLYYIV